VLTGLCMYGYVTLRKMHAAAASAAPAAAAAAVDVLCEAWRRGGADVKGGPET